ncbi:hypothetical protein TNCV_2340031 [Trichonephila clavipes]|nr:hypothetical protein TNCV_2340031 [Trichonephila clavipes]
MYVKYAEARTASPWYGVEARREGVSSGVVTSLDLGSKGRGPSPKAFEGCLIKSSRAQDRETSILMGQAQCFASWPSAGAWVGRPKTMGVAISRARWVDACLLRLPRRSVLLQSLL